MADLGDLTNFMKEGFISNLEWLDVNEEAYREMDVLPKKNLDIAPDLIALWRHKDESPSSFVPNTGAPKTMGDLSQTHGRLRGYPEDLVRTARFAIMQSTDPEKIRSVLAARYDSAVLMEARPVLTEALTERGLLGRLYIAAEDFPDCSSGGRKASDFVRKYAFEAPFVVAKGACEGCAHRQIQANGSSHCGVFHKQLEIEVPFSDGLAARVERSQMAKGVKVQASTQTPRERIRNAYLAETPTASTSFTGRTQHVAETAPVDTQQVLIAASNLTKQRDAANRQKMLEAQARPVIALLRREMLKGHSEAELARSLKLAFDIRDLEATKSVWGPVFKEAGLYGVVYSTQDSFGDCREGADFLAKHASKVRAIVAGDKCSGCLFNKVSRCMLYGRKLVASTENIVTAETVAAVLDEGRMAGLLPFDAAKRHWGDTPVQALKALHKEASAPSSHASGNHLRGAVERAFQGQARQAQTSTLTKREIVKAASRYMNEGLYGSDLLNVLRGRFSASDLIATQPDLKVVLAEQGLQGIHFVDPTVYDDYGFGCKQAANQHRSRTAVRYLKAGDKCASCVHQTRPGFCSTINKQLVVEPPYIDKLAEQRAILASGKSTEVSYESLMNNGLTMMQEYQLQHREAEVELQERRVVEASVEFGSQKVTL